MAHSLIKEYRYLCSYCMRQAKNFFIVIENNEFELFCEVHYDYYVLKKHSDIQSIEISKDKYTKYMSIR